MWSFKAGFDGQNNSVSTDPTYDPYQGGASNYVSTDPTYNPYGYSGDSSVFSSPGLWGAAIKGVGGYFGAKADADASEDEAKLDAKAKLELAQQQRGYQLDDRASKQAAVSKWSKYFGG